MKKTALAALLIIGFVFLSGATSSTETSQSRRFVLIPADVSSQSPEGIALQEHVLFMLDSDTGKVWEYSRVAAIKSNTGKLSVIPSYFSRVLVEGFDPGTPHDWIMNSINQNMESK